MTEKKSNENRKQNIYVIRELTKREIKRKYARSYLGIAWSILSPLLNMIVVTFIFSYVFSREIEYYPAYYFTGYILSSFFSTATTTAMTSLKDNRSFLFKTKLPRHTFILSRVYTALVNLGFSCIAFVFVLAFLKIPPSLTMLIFPVDVFFLTLFCIGISYALSIWFVFFEDSRNIFGIIITFLSYFTALFYSADNMTPGVQAVINHNPIYTFVKIARDAVIYGKLAEPMFFIQMILWGVGAFFVGKLIFNFNENKVMEKL